MNEIKPIGPQPAWQPGVTIWLAALLISGVISVFVPFVALFSVPILILGFLVSYRKAADI